MIWKLSYVTVLAGSRLLLIAMGAMPGDQNGGSQQAAPACCPRAMTPPGQTKSGNGMTLNPMQFNGRVREAYKAAQENPELLAQLHCYCGCDRTEGHKNLLDCYRGYHGASCNICTEEALQAKKLFDQGAGVEMIREALRARFANK